MKGIPTYLIILTLLIFSCGTSFEGPSEVTEKIEGIYSFKYPTGQIEVVDIKNDKTYIKTIYANQSDFLNNGQPLYQNSGTWTTSGNELEFEHWLVYCEFRDPNKILYKPKPSTMLNVTWYNSTSKHKELIDVYSENGYVFEKIEK